MPEKPMPPLVDLKDVAGLSAPLVKLIKTISAGGGRVSDGISRIANAYFLAHRDAKNEAERIQLVEAAKTQAVVARAKELATLSGSNGPLLQTLDVSGQEITAHLVEVPAEARALQSRSLSYATNQNVWQQLNREAVLNNAAAELEQESEVDPNPVNPDIAARILGIVQDVSNEEMQAIWGKILAGEIKKPGSFSLRTLDVLRNLSQEEASVFSQLAGLIIEIHSITTDNKSRFIYKSSVLSELIPYRDIMLMFDCGLLQSLESAAYDIRLTAGKQRFAMRVGERVMLVQGESADFFMQLSNYSLTTAGIELAKLTTVTTPDKYLREVASIFKDIGLSTSHAEFTGWNGGRVNFEPPFVEI
jgi:hypothetical protein